MRSQKYFYTGAVALVIGVAAGVFVLIARRDGISSGAAGNRPALRELVRAVGATRVIEARLTGGFTWSRMPDVHRGPGGPAPAPLAVEVVAARLSERAAATHSAEALADHATALIVRGRVDSAISALEESVETSPDAASYWSDLAAARLTRFVESDRVTDLPLALDAVERSLAINPLPEALFNKALILDRLNLFTPARDAWQRYLDVDADSPWATEARLRGDLASQHKERAAADAKNQYVRESLADDLLFRWAQAGSAAEADRILVDARNAGDALAQSSRDGLGRDLLRAIDDAAANHATLAAIKTAHAAFGRARAAYKKDDFVTAGREFAIAEQSARGSSRSLALLTRVNRAILSYRSDDVDGAIAQLKTILADAPGDAASIKGRSFWILGLLTALRGNGPDAARDYDSALLALRDADERPNAAFVEMLKASQLDGIGDVEGAWRARISALADTDRESAVQSAALAASNAGWPRAAGVLYELVSAMARAQARDIVLVEAIRGRARALATAGQPDAGRTALDEARRIAAPKTGPGWDLLKAEIDLAESECALPASPAEAAQAGTRALDYFTSSKRDSRLPEVRLARARAYRALGEVEPAEADLLAGIDVLESERTKLDEWRQRAIMGGVIRGLGDQLVEMRVEAGRTGDAFNISERLRGWTLRTSAYGGRVPVTLDEIADAIPDDVLMLWYSVGQDATFAWAIRHHHSRFVRIPATRAQLSRLVTAHNRGDRAASLVLRQRLIDPLIEEFPKARELIIVPDGPLHELPPAALPGIRSQYLVQEHALLVSPNATIIAAAMDRDHDRTPPTALVVGNPQFDRAAFPSLPAIDQSSMEASSIASLYEQKRLLSGAAASRGAILAALPEFDVFHFAGHSLSNTAAPADSRLVVAGGSAEAITAAEISRLPLGHVKVVALSSCESAVGAATQSDGPLGLAQAFLSAGVDTVFASLAPVTDRASRELSVVFHRELQRTGDPVAALQAAQAAMIVDKDPALSAPEAWAPFVVVGAGLMHVH